MDDIKQLTIEDYLASQPRFNGPEYSPEFDQERLGAQLKRVYAVISDGNWYTLQEIQMITGDPQASISAQLRHLRKTRFGSHIIERRSRGDRKDGLFEYRLCK